MDALIQSKVYMHWDM